MTVGSSAGTEKVEGVGKGEGKEKEGRGENGTGGRARETVVERKKIPLHYFGSA